MAGGIDSAHAAPTQFALDLIFADLGSWLQRLVNATCSGWRREITNLGFSHGRWLSLFVPFPSIEARRFLAVVYWQLVDAIT
jgi:hypothetical protein